MRSLPLLVVTSTLVLAGAGWLLWSTGESKEPTQALGLGEESAGETGSRALGPEPELQAPEEEAREERREETVAEAQAQARPQPKTKPEATAPEDPFLRGRVVDEFGTPLEGAEVVAWAIPPQASEMASQGMAGMSASFARMGKKEDTKAGEDGGFFVEMPSLVAEVEVEVLLRGYAKATIQVGRPSELPLDLGDVTLSRGCVIAGRIVDEGSQPVFGAQVELEREDTEDPLGLEAIGMDFGSSGPRTKKDGRFEFLYERPGDYRLVVTHKRRPTREVEGTVRLGEELDLSVVLPAGGVIAGRVDGIPDDLRGVIVQARRVIDQSAAAIQDDDEDGSMLGAVFEEMGMSTGDHWAKVRDGKFELDGLETDGQYVVWAAAPHRQMFMREACSPEWTAQVGDSDVVLTFSPGTRLTFQVLDAETRRPVERLEVISKLGGGNLPPRRDEFKGDEGRVLLSNLRPKEAGSDLELMVRAVGYQTYRSETQVTPTGELGLGVVYLHPAPVVRVRVTDGRGRPQVGASVWLAKEDTDFQELVVAGGGFGNMAMVDLDDEQDLAPRTGETDTQGEVVLNSMPGVDAALTVRGSGHAIYRELLTLPVVGDVERDVALSVGGTLEVSLVDSEGYAVVKGRVEHRADEDAAGGMRGTYTADDTGLVVLENLTPGVHFLRAKPAGQQAFGGPRRRRDRETGGAEWIEVQVSDGEAEAITLALPVYGSLSGTITEAGRLLPGASLSLILIEGDEDEDGVVVEGIEAWIATATDTTDERGVYQMVDVPVGKYRLQVRHPDRVMGSRAVLEVSEGDTVFDLDLEVTGVSGRIVDDRGKPIEGAKVSAIPASEVGRPRLGLRFLFGGNERSSVRTDADGQFDLRGLTADEAVVVRAEAAWHSPANSAEMTLASGELREDVDLALSAAGSLLVEIEGTGMFDNVRLVRLEEGEQTDTKRVALSRRGRASFEDLEPGTWLVRIEGEDHGTVEVERGAQARFQAVLSNDE